MANAARLLFYALLVWAPLPLASNRAVLWLINGVWAVAILALFILGEYAARGEKQINWRPSVWVVGGITVWTVWMLVQAVPITPAALHHPVWSSLGDAIPGARGAISINPAATWATIAEFVPIVLLGLVAFHLAQDRHRARLLLEVILAAAVLIAMLGLIAPYSGLDLVALFDQPHYQGFLTGPFVGRAAAASYMAIGLVAAACLIAARIEERRAATPEERLFDRVSMKAMAWDSAGFIVGFLVLLVALLETGSRGGAIAAMIGVLMVVGFSVSSKRFGLGTGAMVALAAGVVLGVLMQLFGGALFERLQEGVGDQDRMQVYRETIDMIRARPILGQGAGTFADAYPMFQGPGEHNLVWLRAHSTYLQAAAELGLPVFAVLLATIGFIFVVVVRGLLKRVAPMPVALAALGAGAGLAVQSTIDFSVQIQAVALTAVALLGAGFGEAASRKRIAAGSGREPSEANPAEPAGDEPARFERVDVKIPGRTGTTAMPEPAKANAARFERVSVTIPMRQAVSSAELAPGTIPDGMRLYVFGDVHGRFDLVQRLRDAILRDRAEAAPAKVKVIGLGDFIDRGPDSRGVIEAFTTGFFDCEAAFIRGNHEQMLLDFLDDADAAPVWLHNGAVETLRSYGVDLSDTPPRTPAEFERLRTEFRDRLPPSHAAFLGDLPLSLVVGGYFFVHAGARPGVPLLQQKSSDLLWIRQGFVDRDHEFEKIVVHGHTPVDRPYLGKYRINLDTGAYMTNRLSCLVLETRERRILEI